MLGANHSLKLARETGRASDGRGHRMRPSSYRCETWINHNMRMDILFRGDEESCGNLSCGYVAAISGILSY